VKYVNSVFLRNIVDSGSVDDSAIHSVIGMLGAFVQMLHGVATASSLHPSGKSLAKNTKTVKTRLLPRWTLQPTNSKTSRFADSRPLNFFRRTVMR